MNDTDIDGQLPELTDEEMQSNLASIINSAAAAHLASTAHKATGLKLRVIQLGADGTEPAFPTQH
jgi:hypothetical protein